MKKDNQISQLEFSLSAASVHDILHWVMDNSDDTEAMDKINRATFPFTSKYANFAGFNNQSKYNA